MDVVQRGSRQASSETTTPAGSIYDDWEIGQAKLVSMGSPEGTERPSMKEQTSSSTNATGKPSSSLSPPVSSPMSGTQETYASAATHQTRPAPGAPHDSDESFKTALTSIPPPPKGPPKRKVTSGLAARIAQFENIAENTEPSGASSGIPKSPTQLQMPQSPILGSQEVASPTELLPRVPKSPKSPGFSDPSGRRRSSGVQYGLKERPSLFVANPDKSGSSGTSGD